MLPSVPAFVPWLSQAWIAASWQGLLLVSGVAVCLRMLPGLNASRRSAIWAAVLAVLVGLHFPAFFRGAIPGLLSRESGHAGAWVVDAQWTLALAGLWLAVSVFRTARLAEELLRLWAIRRRSSAVTLAPDPAGVELSGLAVCDSPDVSRPCVVGYLHPRILLPEGLRAQLSSAELLQVLLHEKEHIRRGDQWMNLLQKIALAVFPLNPALFLVERRMCLERELACDDRVMRVTGARKAYAACLARIAEHRLAGRGAALVLGAWDRRPELVRRVERILKGTPAEAKGWRPGICAGLVVLGSVAGAMTLVQSPELIRFQSNAEPVAAYMPLQQPSTRPETSYEKTGYGTVQMVKATLPVSGGPQRVRPARSRRLPLRRTSNSAVLTQRTLRTVPGRRIDVSWKSGSPMASPEEQFWFVPAVVYLVPTPRGWLVVQL